MTMTNDDQNSADLELALTIMQRAMTDRDPEVRGMGIMALCQVPHAQAITRVCEFLFSGERDPQVLENTVRALQHNNPQLVEQVLLPMVKQALADDPHKMDSKNMPPVVALCVVGSDDSFDILANYCMTHTSTNVRKAFIIYLGTRLTRKHDALTLLNTLIDDDNKDVRLLALDNTYRLTLDQQSNTSSANANTASTNEQGS